VGELDAKVIHAKVISMYNQCTQPDTSCSI
jgi:hypothetical protein